jgi:hypothetical protein
MPTARPVPSLGPTPASDVIATPATPAPPAIAPPTPAPTPAAWTGFTEMGPVDNPFQGMGSGSPEIIPYRSGFEGIGSIRHSAYLADTVAYTSADGLHWTKVDLPVDDVGGASPTDVAASGSRLVAVGQRVGRDPIDLVSSLAWVSDDGTHWRQLSGIQFGGLTVARLAGGPGGFLAWANGSGGSAVFWSPTGERWTPASGPESMLESFMIGGIQPFGSGWVVVGSVFPGSGNQRCQGASWWSPDGLTWHESSLPGRPALRGLRVGSDGMLAVGVGNCEVSFGWPPITLWHSPDGLVWTKLKEYRVFNTETYLDDGQRLFRLVPAGPGLSTVASSTDGLTWTDIGTVGFKGADTDPGYVVGANGFLGILEIQSPRSGRITKVQVAFFAAH